MMIEKELESYLFNGLKNLNDGFDAQSIFYCSEQDFKIVLDRVEAKNLAVYGIEPWLDGQFFGVEVYESHNLAATDPAWYRTAFESFRQQEPRLMYAMSYGIDG
ncbi:MAG: hypothetical protein Q4G28_02040 [Neisseria sp.]|nr:hypothetical protein [Neisseria sp.]